MIIGNILVCIVLGILSMGLFAAMGINCMKGTNYTAFLCLMTGITTLAAPYALLCLSLQSRWLGRVMSLDYLNQETIYTVCGQIETAADKIIVALKDPRGEIRCVEISQSLSPGTQRVKKIFVKTGKFTGGIPLAEVRLEPVDDR